MAAKDLLVLTACKDAQYAVKGMLSRPARLRIRPVTAGYFVHPNRDAGCVNTAHEILRSQQSLYSKCIVLFDREGSGRDATDAEALEADVLQRVAGVGWAGRAEVVVVSPELEAWVWSSSSQVDRILGWNGQTPTLRDWLRNNNRLGEEASKPDRPKEALEAALEWAGVQRSSAIYKELAEHVSLEHCQDRAFVKLRTVLRTWFGPQ